MKFFLKFLAFIAFFAIVPSQSRTQAVRISQTKCESYKSLVTSEHCKKFQTPELIIEKMNASLGEFPHMAAIGWVLPTSNYRFACEGSLISEKFVLTVAHCKFYNRKTPDTVRLGEHSLSDLDDGAEPVEYKVKNFISHEKYNAVMKENDIALIELNTTVTFTNFIRPACLNQDVILPDTVIASGWGYDIKKLIQRDELKMTSLEVIDQKDCSDEYYEEEDITIYPSQICVGNKTAPKDTCVNFAGGPIQIRFPDAQCVYKVVGLISFGSYICESFTPAVYTRVSSYLDWIESKVWPQ